VEIEAALNQIEKESTERKIYHAIAVELENQEYTNDSIYLKKHYNPHSKLH
jgi:hypothetical protein